MVAAIGSVGGPAEAHGLAQRYDLPIPLNVYLFGAGAAVALSFLAVAGFSRGRGARIQDGCQGRAVLCLPPTACQALGVVSAALFLGLLACGFWGAPDTLKNPLPVAVWAVWWVAFPIFALLAVDLWPVANPWMALFRLCGGATLASQPPPLRYPERLGAWPAVVLYLVFAWMELAWSEGEHPRPLAAAILAYSVLCWMGMALFGPETWLRNADPFARALSLLGRVAPFALTPSGEARTVLVRPYGRALLTNPPANTAALTFVVLLLATVSYDGFLETPFAVTLTETLLDAPALAPFWAALVAANLEPGLVLRAAGLPVASVLLLAAYWAAVASMPSPPDGPSVRARAFAFALALVPIAGAYAIAHYLWFFLVAGQYLIPIASDPLGRGWNVFGTALYLVDFGVVDARFIWSTAIVVVVAGHALAVWTGHRVALRLYGSPAVAMRSQIPMLALMVGYTMTSLWILAQPLVA